MAIELEPAKRPELFFGLVAPIGVDLDVVTNVLSELLQSMSYDASIIQLTKHMRELKVDSDPPTDFYIGTYKEKIQYANRIRQKFGDNALAALAVSAIRQIRKAENSKAARKSLASQKAKALREAEEVPLDAHAYVIRQFKVPEEVALLRRVYGRQFILISAYSPRKDRVRRIKSKERDARGGLISEEVVESAAQAIVAQDEKEASDEHGQNLRDCFPLGDVFIDASSREACEKTLSRFIDLLFGSNRISPSFHEYGMYLAKSASLRSSDLSRQVGAAIFTPNREVVSLGCNEVPKAGGGTYWMGDPGDMRDIMTGLDPNDRYKKELLVDLIDRLAKRKAFAKAFVKKRDSIEIVRDLLEETDVSSVAQSRIMDIIEFGRIIHAEMSAISDAARLGRRLKDSLLFCTTFPCHLCAKHIVASGINRVLFIEPYPKSYATELHGDSIVLEDTDCSNKVVFVPFIGISPFRYREFFERGKRKYRGIAKDWHLGEKRPMIEVFSPSYFEAELRVVKILKPVN